jgi:hypothetical protein
MQVSKREKVLLDPESGKIDSTFSVKDFFDKEIMFAGYTY